MKYILFLTSVIFLLSACDAEPKNIIDTTIVDNTEVQELGNPIQNKEPDRSYWQKPDLVLSQLGNIEEKVIADIGAGMGYFSFELSKRKAKKVIAIDIDTSMINTLNFFKNLMEEKEPDFGERFEVRHATSDNPNLQEDEVDIILIVNTIAYISPKNEYLKNLNSKLRAGGKLIIVDFKTKKIPDNVNAPSYDNREYLHVIEEELEASGFSTYTSDDTTLDFQYIITTLDFQYIITAEK